MNPIPHDTWIERVLGYEELAPVPRAETDEHLLGCASCRALRARLLAGERAAFATPELPAPGAEVLAGLAPDELAAERASREALLRRVPRARPERRPWGAAHWAWTTVAAAAAVVLLVTTWPRGPVAPPTGAIERDSGLRGEAPGAWRAGDAFRLHLALPRAGHVVVLHVDAAGGVSRLYPAPPAAASPRFEAGDVTLPPPGDDARWTFTGEPGGETFLVARTDRDTPDAARLEALARAAARHGTPRDSVIADVRAAIERAAGPVLRLDATHGR